MTTASPAKKAVRTRFPISTEECELLCAFKNCNGLENLASILAKDATVVSRKLKILGDRLPVLQKKNGRYHLTDLGYLVARWAEASAQEINAIINEQQQAVINQKEATSRRMPQSLLVVGAQGGFLQMPGGFYPLDAVTKIKDLIAYFRNTEREVIYVNLVSTSKISPFFPGCSGSRNILELKPFKKDEVLNRHFNDPFSDSQLNEILQKKSIKSFAVCGFSLNHCVDATVRRASDLGYDVTLVADATGCFDRIGFQGVKISSKNIADAIVANIVSEYSTVLNVNELISLDSIGKVQ